MSAESAAATPGVATRTLTLQPRFGSVFRGLWSFTWKSAVTPRKFIHLLLVIIGLPVLMLITLDRGKTSPYLHFAVDFYLFLILPLHCLTAFGAMIRDDIQNDTIGFLTTRPVTRARLFVAKYLCNLVWMELILFLHACLLMALGFYNDIPGMTTFAPLFLLAQVLGVLVYGALSSLLGLVHQRFMVLGLIYGFLVEIGIGRIPTNINALSMSHHLQTLLANHSLINEHYEWIATGTGRSILMLFLATGVFLAAGAALFTLREYHHTAEMQK